MLGLMMALLNRGLHKMMVEWGGGGGLSNITG